MKSIIETNDIKEELMLVATILRKLRYTTQYWEEHYGALPRNAKKYWEKKADDWIKSKIKDEEDESK